MQTVNRWHSSLGYSKMYQSPGKKIDFVSEWQSTQATSESLSSFSLSIVLFLPPQLCIRSFYFDHSFVWAYSQTALISAPAARPNLASCLDLMSSWPTGISPFASSVNPCSRLTRFGDFTRLCKKKKKCHFSCRVDKENGWKKQSRSYWPCLERVLSWPGFCKAPKALDITVDMNMCDLRRSHDPLVFRAF